MLDSIIMASIISEKSIMKSLDRGDYVVVEDFKTNIVPLIRQAYTRYLFSDVGGCFTKAIRYAEEQGYIKKRSASLSDSSFMGDFLKPTICQMQTQGSEQLMLDI